MRVGELAKAARTKVSAIRYYERIGLLAPTSRTVNGYREYADDAVRRIALIHRAKEVGFSLREVSTLLGHSGRRASEATVRDLIDRKLAALRDRRASLHAIEGDLLALRARMASSPESRAPALEVLSQIFTLTEVPAMTTRVPGWLLAGRHSESYAIGIADELHGEKRVAYLRCTGDPGDGFGTMMQVIGADDFVGARLSFTGFVRTESVARAGLWLRIDGPQGQQLTFDNMQTRPITGTTAWTRHRIVLDVDASARRIAFGVLLIGVGEVRITDCALERAATDVPTTVPAVPTQPRSLDFGERSSSSVA